jgi:hypothetical protein
MNCYYSNLITGHDAHPIDIERALSGCQRQGCPKARFAEGSEGAHRRTEMDRRRRPEKRFGTSPEFTGPSEPLEIHRLGDSTRISSSVTRRKTEFIVLIAKKGLCASVRIARTPPA